MPPQDLAGGVRVVNALISDGATDLLRDREGNLWLSCLRGVSKVVGLGLEVYTSAHGLLHDQVTAIQHLASGEVVLGHEGGLTFFGDGEPRTLDFDGDPALGRVMCLEEDEQGSLWIATIGLGLGELDSAGQLTWHPVPGMGALYSLLAEGDDLWVGTQLGLFKRLEDGDFHWVRSTGGPDHFSVRRLYLGTGDRLWMASGGSGLLCRSADGAMAVRTANGPMGDSLFAVLETREGRILVGAQTGLWEVSGDHLVPLWTPMPIERPVYMLLEQPDGTLWIGTDHGVARWSGDEMHWFGPAQGLAGPEVNRDAGLLAEDGSLWVGTDRGLTILHPDPRKRSSSGPEVELIAFDDGEAVRDLGEPELEVRPHSGALMWRFRAISFVDELRVRFLYRLEGLDEDWIGPVALPTREVRYNSLPPGSYRLKLMAEDVNGRRSAVVTSPTVRVRAPLIQRGWFLALLAVGLLGVAAVSALAFGQRAYARRLREEVRLRTRQLEDSERALTTDRERLAVTLSSITDGLTATDAEGRVFLWNRAAETLTGRGAPEVLGKSLDQALGLRNPGPELESLLGGEPFSELAHTLRRADGELRQVELSGAPIAAGERPTGAVVAFRDVTRRLALERELASTQHLESLGLLAGGIAHDFNNYLTVILGTLGFLSEESSLSEETREQVRLAEEATERAASLTGQLLTFSKGGAPVRKTVSLGSLVRDTAAFVLSGANVSSEVRIDPDLRPADVDEGQVAEVLHNLVLNARQAMLGGGTVYLAGRNLERGPPGLGSGPFVELAVHDDGIGIPPEDLARVFDPFFTRRTGGTGLGLAVAHSIVDRHGGRLSVESTPGQGTTFRVLLPASDQAPRPAEVTLHAKPRAGARVLVMDDDPSIRSLLMRMLSLLGHGVECAPDGQRALELYTAASKGGRPFDLAVLDLTIPGGMGGLETARALLELDPDARLIAASGYSTDAVIGSHGRYGFRSSLAKPFRMGELERALELAFADNSRDGKSSKGPLGSPSS
jgi:PAS domain S-box-containing protein